jgi:aminoglycoside phosphotransferase (APT) family kinase protein
MDDRAMNDAAVNDAATDDPDVLGKALSSVLGAPVRDLRPLAGGASRQTWYFEVEDPSGAGVSRRVLRRDPPASPRPDSMRAEATILLAAHEAGVPVPAVRGHGDGSDGVGSPYLIMDYLEGETIARRLLRDPRWERARTGLVAELGRALARIHSIRPDGLNLEQAEPLERLRGHHGEFGDFGEFAEPRPALELVLRWLDENRPPSGPRRVLHGDFRNGNLMIGPDGLVAVLDWERAHFGDPVQDLGWLCVKAWRFGAVAPVGGFGPRDELLDGYAEVAGWRPSEEALRWWEVYGTCEWAAICRRQAQRHLSGGEPSVELAVLGRRVCESEWDALLALGLAQPCVLTDALESPDPDLGAMERPTQDELLAATAGFLAEDLPGTDDRARFHARVAVNALKIARRELRVGAAHSLAHRERLEALGCVDDAALVAAIHDGTLDDRRSEVLDAVRALTLDRLAVANPRYPAQAGA